MDSNSDTLAPLAPGGTADVSIIADGADASTSSNIISKRQAKRYKQRDEWIKIRKEKRQEFRQRKKFKRQEAKEKGIEMDEGPSRSQLKRTTMAQSLCKIKVVIDMSMHSLMTDSELTKAICQFKFCYSANRRSKNPLQLNITGVNGRIAELHSWDIDVHENDLKDVFDVKRIVYLSSESDNVLNELNDDDVYVIGGLVDHNHHKGYCKNMAEELGFRHAQLPLGQFLNEMTTRKVLTINHVFQILVHFTECGDWRESFLKSIPKRKLNNE